MAFQPIVVGLAVGPVGDSEADVIIPPSDEDQDGIAHGPEEALQLQNEPARRLIFKTNILITNTVGLDLVSCRHYSKHFT